MSNPLEHDPARPIVIDGVDYTMEGQQGSDLALFNTLTGQTLSMKYTAVMRRCGLSDLSLENVVMARAADEHLTPLAKWKKDFLTRHVEEVAYGKPLDAESYRPEYDPENSTQNERLDRKARELAPLYMRGTSRSNLKKLVGKLKSQDSAGLVDGRSTRLQDPFAGIDSRLFTMMAGGWKKRKTIQLPRPSSSSPRSVAIGLKSTRAKWACCPPRKPCAASSKYLPRAATPQAAPTIGAPTREVRNATSLPGPRTPPGSIPRWTAGQST
jgi:hypothetical protein